MDQDRVDIAIDDIQLDARACTSENTTSLPLYYPTPYKQVTAPPRQACPFHSLFSTT